MDFSHISYVRIGFSRFIGYSLVQIGNSLSAWNAVMPSGRFLGRNAEFDPNVLYGVFYHNNYLGKQHYTSIFVSGLK